MTWGRDSYGGSEVPTKRPQRAWGVLPQTTKVSRKVDKEKKQKFSVNDQKSWNCEVTKLRQIGMAHRGTREGRSEEAKLSL